MSAIGNIDARGLAPVQIGQLPDHTDQAWQAIVAQLALALRDRGAHPGRTVILLPYAQLMPVARRCWIEHIDPVAGSGFLPRFETTMNWANTLALQSSAPILLDGLDIRLNMACDMLVAERLLVQAGLSGQRDDLAPLLVEAAWQLASCVAAQPPDQRAAWAAQARMAVQGSSGASAGMANAGDVLRYERALAQIALEWALASGYASDALFDPATVAALDCLVQVRGLQSDALAAALVAHYGSKAFVLDGLSEGGSTPSPGPNGTGLATALPALHECTHAADEA